MPVSVLNALDFRQADGALAGASGDAAPPCAQTRTLPFVALDDIEVSVGKGVRLVIGDPPYVMNDSVQLGALTGPQADAARACLEEGYRMSGVVSRFDVEERAGEVRVRGRRD